MAAGALAGIAIGNNVTRLKKNIEAANDVWKALEARGLSLRQAEMSGFQAASGKQRPYLLGTVDGCAVDVHIRSDMVHYATTEVGASAPQGVDAVVGVHPSPGGLLGYLRSWLGQDIELGDPFFDEQFLVTAKPASAAKHYLDSAFRERILAVVTLAGPRFGGFRYTPQRPQVVLHDVELDPAVLERAIEVVSAAARWQP